MAAARTKKSSKSNQLCHLLFERTNCSNGLLSSAIFSRTCTTQFVAVYALSPCSSSSKNSTEPPTIKHAAANAVFLSPAGDVIAFSGSLGMLLGSREASSSTGLVLNNELHAFTDRGPDRYLGHAGVSLNYARPGKRPLSPLVPSVVLDAEGHELVAAVAASEDSQLPQYAALILCQLLLMNNTVADAVTAPKVRFRASLKGVLYDTNLPLETVQELRNKGHHMLPIEDNVTNAAAIFRDEHKAFAAVNDRVGGYSDNN